MKHRKLCRCIGGLMLIVMLGMQLCGCSLGNHASSDNTVTIEPMEKEEVYTYSFDCIGGQDVMPIVGYYGPQVDSSSAQGQLWPETFSDEVMQMIADCGVNVISANGANYASYPDKTETLLDLGEKYGVGIFVRDSIVNENLNDATLSIEELDERISAYRNHTAFAGVYVVDEPGIPTFRMEGDERYVSNYAQLFQNLNELNTCAYGNLLPLGRIADVEAYKVYLNEYLNSCPVDFLSYDKYPFEDDDSLTNAAIYFKNLELIRSAADSKGIPFWGFIQAGAQWNDAMNYFDSEGYFPEEGPFMWLVNTTLAFGAKGLQYFPLLQPKHFAYALTEPYDFERNGLIGAWNNKNRWWYYAQEANKQIGAIDEVLMNSVNKGILVSGDQVAEDLKGIEYVLEGTSWREVENITGDALVSCFNYNGKSAFYVVNYDTEYAQKITLEFFDKYNMKIVQKAEEKFVKTDSLELTMSAGEGVLVVME